MFVQALSCHSISLKVHEFKEFLKQLQKKTERAGDGQTSGTVITESDCVTKGQVVLKRYEDVEA